MAEGSAGLAELYPLNKSHLPSGDQMGRRAVVRLGATRRGVPPATGITQTVPLPGTASTTAVVPTQYATCEPSGEYTGAVPPCASNLD